MHAELTGQLVSADDAVRFIMAGNATFTIRSKSTGTRFTYKVRKSEQCPTWPGDRWFVSLLRGPDNEGDFFYMGVLERVGEKLPRFRFTKKSTVTPDAKSAEAFVWLWQKLAVNHYMPGNVECWHEGRCGRCGRKLTVPESIEFGIGPECASRMGMAA
jgi:hypothetical protein